MGFLDDLVSKATGPSGPPRADAKLKLAELLVKGDLTRAQALAVEAAVIQETDNGPRPEDGDQSLALPPDETHDDAADDD